MKMFPLRRILAASLVLLASVPAVLVAWTLGRASNESVEELAGKILTQVAALVQAGTENRLRQAHEVLNGLFPERLDASETERARAWLRQPARFEAMAFALTRLSGDVPVLHFANLRGEYLGVETTREGMRIALRPPAGTGRQFYLAREPGDRSHAQPAEAGNFEPRTTAWYTTAMQAKDRAFTPVRVSADRRQLMVSLAQPVFDADGGAAGVFATDLYLQPLADVLRTQRISARGAAFVVDEKGALVASSAGDALFEQQGGRFERRSPAASANPVIRASFAALQAMQAQRRDDTVASDMRLQRLPMQGDALLMVQRPFGEALGLRWTLVVAAPESDFTGEIRRAWKVAAWGGAALIALGALIAFLMARGVGWRLRGLSLAAEQLGRGEVPTIEQGTRIREVHRLSQVLHDSGEQLSKYREQVAAHAQALQQANDTLEARVAERTSQLAASREEALAAARAKAAFLATMSHEIRTPLNGVVGMSTLLAETPLDPEQRDYLQTIRLSSDQLLAVINDILDFSKIESGKLELEVEPVSVRGAVEEACDIAAPRAREKGLELIIDIPESGPGAVPAAILGDVTRLRQVLINLINNAVKFTEKGEVSVQARLREADDGQGRAVLEFRVSDTGIGIPPDRADSLFQAFTQVDASTTRKYGGTGLGLAICKHLVELMGGQIGVESEPGRGSTFWFTIAAPRTELAPAFSPADAGRLKAIRVLVVDDHATNVRVLTRQLHLWGMEVGSAESAREALQALEQAQALPDVIITDMHMPVMDGVDFARRLKRDPAWKGIPVVLLSSGFMPAGDENARLFEARLLKPARQNQLFDTILRCVSAESAASGKVAPATEARKQATVLVADDNAVNLKVACAMLLKLGYEVRTATDGREAVEAVAHAVAQGQRLDAILMDVNMPDVDGLQATRQIQTALGHNAPPIIAVTAAASAEDRARCEAAGMDDYLTKPLQVGALAQALEKWIGVSGAEQPPALASATAASDTAGEPPMDFGRLQEFRDYDDEELTMTREVIGLFLADTPQRLEAIEAAVAARDAQALATAAHALKGSAGNVGATALHKLAGKLEASAKEGWPDDAAAQAAQLQSLWESTRRAIDGWTAG
jgi:signal transduction histidine kinase/CheY-like chemotaxis protein/HPt (histidine-containing phosphotransfer) domain-containing protein